MALKLIGHRVRREHWFGCNGCLGEHVSKDFMEHDLDEKFACHSTQLHLPVMSFTEFGKAGLGWLVGWPRGRGFFQKRDTGLTRESERIKERVRANGQAERGWRLGDGILFHDHNCAPCLLSPLILTHWDRTNSFLHRSVMGLLFFSLHSFAGAVYVPRLTPSFGAPFLHHPFQNSLGSLFFFFEKKKR